MVLKKRYADGGEQDRVALDRLRLDTGNPRLSELGFPSSQTDILKVLYGFMAVDELALSISENGFYQQEVLLVVPEDSDVPEEDRTFIVLEGNRRLAAVRLLTDKTLQKAVGARDIPPISDELAIKLSILPVRKYNEKEELWSFLGFQHINGAKPWSSLSKAEYIARVHEDLSLIHI